MSIKTSWTSVKQTLLDKFEMLTAWSKDVILPFMGDVPLYYIVKFIIEEFKRDSIDTRSNSVAFSFFLSLFPFVIFLLPILAQMPFAINYLDRLEASLVGLVPDEALVYIFNIVDEIGAGQGFGFSYLGIVLAVYFSSNGLLTLMDGFNKSYEGSFRERSFYKSRGIAIFLTILLSLLLVFSIVFVVFGGVFLSWLTERLGIPLLTLVLVQLLRWLSALFAIYVVISMIYKYGPAMVRRTSFWNPGSALATLLIVIVSLGFSYFVNNFGRYNEIYGSIGALIVILLWFKFIAFILLIGFELNAAIAVNRDMNHLSKESE